MVRLPRYFVNDQAQHINQRGTTREPIFVHDEDYHFYLECLQDAVKRNKRKRLMKDVLELSRIFQLVLLIFQGNKASI